MSFQTNFKQIPASPAAIIAYGMWTRAEMHLLLHHSDLTENMYLNFCLFVWKILWLLWLTQPQFSARRC